MPPNPPLFFMTGGLAGDSGVASGDAVVELTVLFEGVGGNGVGGDKGEEDDDDGDEKKRPRFTS